MKRVLRAAAVVAVLCATAVAAERPPGFALSSAHPLATAAGVEALEAGGNAFDAAVAVTAALAVVEPTGSGLGGGGFYLLHVADSGIKTFIDARERAPLAATADMYLDENGAVQQQWLRRGPRAAGIPGIPAALAHLAGRYGRLPLAQLLAPAILHAEQGFAVDEKLAAVIRGREADLRLSPAAAAVFLPQGRPPEPGQVLVQPDLAVTLRRIAEDGAHGFYTGRLSRKLVKGVKAGGGIWSMDDLEQYRSVERLPVILEYRGWEIVAAPPPSSGGLVIGEVFNILSGYDWGALDRVDRVHLLAEAWRRAYRDRALYMGDTDFVDVPSGRLLRRDYAEQQRAGIDLRKATPSASLGPPPAPAGDGRNTTHFSVIDQLGNRVAATLSINWSLGAAWMPPGTGILLNNEMDDFVAKPGVPNAYGLVGGEANAIAPGKRMLSSMSPTFVSGADRVVVLGTPGGSRIITMVMLGILEFIDGADAQTIVSAPRFHHQYLPDVIQFEPGALSETERAALEARGHRLEARAAGFGNMHAVIWDRRNGRLDAAADPRGVGRAVVAVPSALAGPVVEGRPGE